MQTEVIIEAGGRNAQYWRELWRYRELFLLLAWRDLLVRYKETAAGVAWAVVRPMVAMVIFVFVFGRVAKLPSGGVPYPLLVLAGLLPWQFFSTALAESGNSLLNNSNLVSKVYFPRLVLPASTVVTTFADMLISFVLLGILMLWFGHFPGAALLALPLFIAMGLVIALGAALWLAALTVRFRDLRFVTPFIVQFGFFLSPVGYSSTVVPEHLRLVYSLNPLVGIIDGFRWVLLGENLFLPSVLLSAAISTAVLLTGVIYFRKTERGFADMI